MKLTHPCRVCGNPVKLNKHKFCSQRCHGVVVSGQQKGQNNSNYTGRYGEGGYQKGKNSSIIYSAIGMINHDLKLKVNDLPDEIIKGFCKLIEVKQKILGKKSWLDFKKMEIKNITYSHLNKNRDPKTGRFIK